MAKRAIGGRRVHEQRHVLDRDTLTHIGARLRALRVKRGFSQEYLAERAGLTSKFLGEVERVETNPSITSMVRLAQALHVNLGDLYDPTEEIIPVAAAGMDRLHEVYHSLGVAIQALETAPDVVVAVAAGPARPRRRRPQVPRRFSRR